MLNALYRYLRVSPEELKALYTSTLYYMRQEYETMCRLLASTQNDQARLLAATYQQAIDNIEAELEDRKSTGAEPMPYPPLGDLASASMTDAYGSSH